MDLSFADDNQLGLRCIGRPSVNSVEKASATGCRQVETKKWLNVPVKTSHGANRSIMGRLCGIRKYSVFVVTVQQLRDTIGHI